MSDGSPGRSLVSDSSSISPLLVQALRGILCDKYLRTMAHPLLNRKATRFSVVHFQFKYRHFALLLLPLLRVVHRLTGDLFQ